MAPGSRSIASKGPPLENQESNGHQVKKRLITRNKSENNRAMKKHLPYGWLYECNGMILNFRVEEMVGEGSYGKVYRARILETNEIVAIKYIEIQPGSMFREYDILKSLQHRTICQLKFSLVTKERNKTAVLLVMEYVPCSLFSVIHGCEQAHQRMDENYVMLVMFQLLTGVSYLHSKGICHRDLKPANILLNISTNELKICDFGCAKLLRNDDQNASYVCSRFYRAPEVILSCPYTKAIDLWSVGCIFVELYERKVLFKGMSSIDQLVQIIMVLGTPTLTDLRDLGKVEAAFTFRRCPPKQWREVLRSTISDQAVDLISKMLVYSPIKRITAHEALRHKYFNPINQPGFSIGKDVQIPQLFDPEDNRSDRI